MIGRRESLGTDAESVHPAAVHAQDLFLFELSCTREINDQEQTKTPVSRAKSEAILRVRVENFADFAGKGVQFKRFFEVVVAMFGNAAANGGIVGVTGHE